MWKYTHTDEMYHSLTNGNNELFHSDVYLGQDYSDGIRHFKYIHKEKGPDGKWRYYYEHTDKVFLTSRGIRKDSSVYEKTKGSHKSKYGTYERDRGSTVNWKDGSINPGYRDVHTVKKGNSLFTKTRVTGASKIKGKTTVNTTTEVGKIRQGMDAVGSATNKAVKKAKKNIKKSIKKGKKAVDKFIDKINTTPEEAKAGTKNTIMLPTYKVKKKKKK